MPNPKRLGSTHAPSPLAAAAAIPASESVLSTSSTIRDFLALKSFEEDNAAEARKKLQRRPASPDRGEKGRIMVGGRVSELKKKVVPRGQKSVAK